MRAISRIFLPLYLTTLLTFTLGNALNSVEVTLRNELTENVVIYWEGPDELIENGAIEPKGGEMTVVTFPDHRFSYDFGGHRHSIIIPHSDPSPYIVLLGGQSEIGVQCTTTSNGSTGDDRELGLRIIPWWSPVFCFSH